MQPTFLVLTDLSAAAERAAQFAATLAAPLGGRLVLLHLFHDPLLAPELVTVTAELAYRNQTETAAELQQLARRLPVPAEPEVTIAGLYEAVLDAINRYQPLLAVVGVSPEHDLLDRLLNNQAWPVLRTLPLPLLLVPEATRASRLPRRVAVAADAESFVLSPASFALRPVLAAWDAGYTVVHVADAPGTAHEAAVRVRHHLWNSGLLPASEPCDTYAIAKADVAASIRQAAVDVQAEVVLLPVRPRSFLGRLFHRSVVARLLRRCPCPVLLLPTEA